MAKRTRGSRRDRRHQGRPVARGAAPGTAPSALGPPAGGRPAAIEAPPGGAGSRSTVPPAGQRSAATRPSSALAARAAQDYRYVVLDVRRIAVVVGLLVAVMLALWVVIEVAGLVRI